MKKCSCVYEFFSIAGNEFGILCRIGEKIHFAKSCGGLSWVQRSSKLQNGIPTTACIAYIDSLIGKECLCQEFRFDGFLRFHTLDADGFFDLRVASYEVGRVDGISVVEGRLYWGTVGGEIVALSKDGVQEVVGAPEVQGARMVAMVNRSLALLIHPQSGRLCLYFTEENRTQVLPKIPIAREVAGSWVNSGKVRVIKCGRFLSVHADGRGLWLLESTPEGEFKTHGLFGTKVSRSNHPGWIKVAAYDGVLNRIYMVGAKARIPDITWHKPKYVQWVGWIDLNGEVPTEYMPEDVDNSKGFGREQPVGFLLPHAPLVMCATGNLYDFDGKLVSSNLEIE